MDKSNSTVVLVHGLWNRGWSMMALAKRLRSRGFNVEVFSYPTRSNNLDGHAKDLNAFLGTVGTQSLHLVGHSMGGLVILKLLSLFDDLPPGRIVLMGTPVKGSGVVKRFQIIPGHKLLFGKVWDDLLSGFEYTPQRRETGMISGTRPVGLGRVSGKHEEPNDGSVVLSETVLEGLKDSIELEVAHSEMLVSPEVVDQVEQFLLHGEFARQS